MGIKNEFLRGKPKDAKDEQFINFMMKVITLFAVFIGIWLATQRFAKLLNFDPAWVGSPFYVIQIKSFIYPLYFPLLIFYWSLIYFKQVQIHEIFYSAWKIAGGVSISAIVFYFLVEFVLMKYITQNIFGTARWANKKDLVKAGLLQNKGGMVLGQLADADVFPAYDKTRDSIILHQKKPSQKIIQSGIYNTNVAAPTRSGKGVSIVQPTILSYPGSMIILDFKGESFDITSGYRSKFGKIYRWAPTGETGHHFNPLDEIPSGEEAFSFGNLIADILTTPASGGGNATSEHFQVGAKDILTGVILHCKFSDWKNKSLPGCVEFLAQGDPTNPDNNKYLWDLMISSDHGDEVIHQAIVESARAQRNRPSDEGASMLSTVNNALAVFKDPIIKRNTAESEFYVDEFEETKRPITLYLTIQYRDVERIAPLIRMFVLLFSRKFTGGETSANNRKFEVPILFLLDEFDKLGKMDELERNMGIHNGFGIHYLLIYQSLNQLSKIYGKEHSFLAHCRNSIFFAPGSGEVDSAELISKVCGKESISRTNISYSGGKAQVGYSNKNISSQDQERNLINADEIMKLPLDQAILLCQGLPPYICKKNVYYEDPIFSVRAYNPKKNTNPPAFTTREGAIKIAASTIAKIKKRNMATHGETQRTVQMDDPEDIASMWEKVEGVFDLPVTTERPEAVSVNDFSEDSDSDNFL